MADVTHDDRFAKFRVANFPQTSLSNYVPADGVEVKFLDGCNRSCTFCVNEDHIGKIMNPIDAGKFNESLFAWLDDPDEPEKPEAVYGTGGEPLMVLDAVESVFGPLAERGVTTRLVTNGTLLTTQRIARLVGMGLTGVKVTYNTTDSERLFALMKGAREDDVTKLLENIRLAKDAGLWVFIRIGMGRHNHDEVVKIYDIMRDIGVDVVQIKPWIPSGYAAKNQGELSLSPQRLFDVFMGLAEHMAEDLASGAGPEVTVSCYPPARELGFTVKDCANVAKIYCEPGGTALVCNFAEEYLGNWYPEQGGLLGVVRKRREIYHRIIDDHGVASCPARLNWSAPTPVVSASPAWKSLPIVPVSPPPGPA
jgi:pyruvate-formate lyase-activating enzyme